MNVVSFTFLAFCISVFIPYWMFKKWQNWILLAANLVFLASYSTLSILLFALMTVFTYFVARRMHSRPRDVLLAVLGVGAGFFVLVLIKGLSQFGPRDLFFALPLGISYYTFQNAGVLFDIRRGRLQSSPSSTRFMLFNSFFPQLSMGPIERAPRMLPQYERTREFNSLQFCEGLFLISLGLFKKMVLADRLVQYFNDFSKFYPKASPLGLWLLLLLLFFQVFLDFSGFIDIMRGIAKTFGLELIDNFYQPYFARNPSDLWTRWHYSLVSWLREYVFWPLALRLRNPFVPTILIIFVIGFWHRISWSYFMWSCYWSLLITAYFNWQRWRKRMPFNASVTSFIKRSGIPIMLVASAYSSIFFVQGGLTDFGSVNLRLWDVARFFSGQTWIDFNDELLCVLGILLVITIESIHRGRAREIASRGLAHIFYLTCYTLLIAAVVIYGVSTSYPFLYLSI